MEKPTKKMTPNTNTTADIRSKVPTALYDKIIMRYGLFHFWLMTTQYHIFRLQKGGEKPLMTKEIQTRVHQIEEEMYRVHGKVDNSYKNKFRSLLANISNVNNNVY